MSAIVVLAISVTYMYCTTTWQPTSPITHYQVERSAGYFRQRAGKPILPNTGKNPAAACQGYTRNIRTTTARDREAMNTAGHANASVLTHTHTRACAESS